MGRNGLERGARLGAAALILIAGTARAEEPHPSEPPKPPVQVGDPVVPVVTRAARDLPDAIADPNLFGLEMPQVGDYPETPSPYALKSRVDPLLHLQGTDGPRLPDGFGVPVHNYEGYQSHVSPPDATVDVGPNHVVQVMNGPSFVTVLDKATGTVLKTFYMEDLTTASPCRFGFCDPQVLYDRAADRWLIAEIGGGYANTLCVYVSTGPDPTGTWYAYMFAVESIDIIADYPKFGVWPQTGGGSYLVGINGGESGTRDIAAFDRAKMLAGQPAPFQKFTFARTLAGPQVMLPTTMQGPTPPPDGEPAIFIRHIDDEWHYGVDTPATDWLELRSLQIDWQTPANSALTLLPPVTISEFKSPCIGNLECMHQPKTFRRIVALVPLLHPLQYRNFGDHETIVGTFDVDSDGSGDVGLRWFELRKTGASSWSLFQEGTFGGGTNLHRSIGSVAMDGSGNIAIGYSRMGRVEPYYPSIYYRGRLSTDPLGTMPQGEYSIWDGTTSKTTDENRWGDYAGIGIDPSDDCTFWYTNQFGGFGETRVAAFKFDSCGCLAVPPTPAIAATAPSGNRVDVTWNDSSTASIVSYRLYRATSAGGPYAQLADVADSSPGAPEGPSYVYHDDSVSGGTHYYYLVKSSDGDTCISDRSNEANVLATGACTLAPNFAGAGAMTNPGTSTCTLNLAWTAATAACSGSVKYNVYRSTAGDFIPGPENRVATGLSTLNFTDAVGLAGGTTYFYVVRAVGGNGVEDVNVVRRNAMAAGLIPLNWTETFEGAQSGGGFDQEGWTKQVLSGAKSWTWTTDRSYDGAHSWHAPGDVWFGDRVLVSPPFVVVAGTTLSFRHWYFFEGTAAECFDAATLEYTIDAGTTWTVVPPTDFINGGYNGTANLATGNPIGGKRAWCADNAGVFSSPTISLGNDLALRNRTVQLRWHEGDNIQSQSFGWYVDTVILSNARSASACSVGIGALTVSNNGPVCEGASLNLSAGYSQAGVTYSWTGPNGFTSSFQNPSIPNSSLAADGTYFVTVSAGPTLVASSSTVASVIADGGACTDGNACTIDETCGGGACTGGPAPVPGTAAGLGFGTPSELSWDPVAGATGYDVLRGSLSTLKYLGDFTGAPDACLANDLAAMSLSDTNVPMPDDGDWYLVRGRSACGNGTYDDGSASEIASRDAAIAASDTTCP